MDRKWFVYIIEAKNGHFYTGVSTDPERRFQEHLGGPKQAKFFRRSPPKKFRYLEECASQSVALRREAEIKGFTRAKKASLFGLPHNLNRAIRRAKGVSA